MVLVNWYGIFIRSNLQVAQNGRFLINPIYPGGSTMFANLLDFGLSESMKVCFPATICSPKLSLQSLILYCLRENFLEYPPNITTGTSIMVYLTPILWFKNYKLCIGFQILPDASFASVKIINAFVDTILKLTIKTVDKSNVRT